MSAQISQLSPNKIDARQSGGHAGLSGAAGLTGGRLTGAAGAGSPFDLLLAMTLSLGEVGKALDGAPTPSPSRGISQPDLFAFADTASANDMESGLAAFFAAADSPVKLPGSDLAPLFAKQQLSDDDAAGLAELTELGIELPENRAENASLASMLARSLVTAGQPEPQPADSETDAQPVDEPALDFDPAREPLLWAARNTVPDYTTTPRESLGLVVSQAAQWKSPADLLAQKNKSGAGATALLSNGKPSSVDGSGQSAARVWNIQELTQHLQDIMRSRVQESQMASLADANLEGDAAETTTQASLLKKASATDGSALDKLFANTMKAASLKAAGAGQIKAADTDASDTPELRNDTVRPTTVHQWQARPIAAGPEAGRMPDMIAQIREISEFLAERTQGTIRLGERTVEANLRLFPPDLGGVRVEIQVTQNQSVQVQFITERADTARLIEQQTAQLRDALGRHGLTVDRVQIGVAPSASSSGGSENLHGQLRREADSSAREQAQQRRENSRNSNDSNSNKQDQ